MNIEILGGIYGGGAERQVCILANYLARRHNVTIGTTAKVDSPHYDLDSRVNIHHMIKGINDIKGWRHFYRHVALFNELRRKDIDVYISFITSLSSECLKYNRILHRPIIATERTSMSRFISKDNEYARKVLYKEAAKVVFVTKTDFERSTHLNNGTYIYNPLSLKPCREFLSREKRVIAIGGMNRWKVKGFDLLLQAWAKIAKNYPEWKVQFAGKVNDNTIPDLAKELGIENQVEFLGHQDDMAALLSTKSIYVLSSRNEGFPNSLTEAMSQRCACVAYDCETGPNEIIENEVNGLLIEPQSVDGLATAIARLIEDEQLRTKFAEEGVKVAEVFDSEKMLEKWEKIVFEVYNNNIKR